MKKSSIVIALSICIAFILIACVPTPSTANVKKTYENNGYQVVLDQFDDQNSPKEGVTAELTATSIKSRDDYVSISWYKKNADASARRKELENAFKDNPDAYVLQKGNMVAFGSKNAIELIK